MVDDGRGNGSTSSSSSGPPASRQSPAGTSSSSGSSSSGSGSSSPPPGQKPGTTPPHFDGNPLGDGQAGGTGPVSAPPTVPGGADHPGKGQVSVNTIAMKTYANNLLSQVESGSPFAQAQSALADVNIRPGGFRSAINLTSQINGSNGLQGELQTVLGQITQAVTEAADAVLRIASNYDSIDKANGMTTDQYNSYMAGVTGDIQTLTGGLGSSGGASGGSGGSGGGSGSGSSGGSGSGSTG